MKELLKKSVSGIENLIKSDWYIVIFAIFVFLGWISGYWVGVICFLLGVTILATICFNTFKPLLCLLIMIAATMGTQRVTKTDIILITVFGVCQAIAVVCNLLIFKPDWSVISPKNIKGFSFAQILFVIPFLFAGLGYKDNNVKANLVAAGIMALIAIIYLLIYVGAKTNKDQNYMDYVIKALFGLTCVATVEFVICLIRIEDLSQITNMLIWKAIWFGWTGHNTFASVLSMGIPCALYLCIREQKCFYIGIPLATFMMFVEFGLMVLTGSRGAMLFTILLLPSMLLYTMWQTKHKLTFFISFSVCFLFIILVTLKFNKEISKILITILNKGLDSSSRVESIYPEAVGLFNQNKLFGVGWGYKLAPNLAGFLQPYLFHSTFFQVLANMGILGVICLVIFFLWRYFLVLPMYKKPGAVLIMVAIFVFDMYSMIDTSIFNPMLFIVLSCLSLAMELDMPDGKCCAFLGKDPLSIFKRKRLDK